MEELVGRIFAGHLRSIIGGLTVEEIIRERDRVAQEIKDGSHAEMEKLGIVVDALQIQEIEDATGYINNLAAPHAAAVASQARIAARQGRPGGGRARAGGRGAEGPVRAGHRRSSGPASWPRPSRPRPRPPRPARWPRPRPPRRSSSSRRRWPSARPNWPPSASRPRSAGRPTPRPTGSAPWPKPSGTRRSSQAEGEAYRRTTLADAEAQAVKVQADGTAYAERTIAEAQAEANKARATSLKRRQPGAHRRQPHHRGSPADRRSRRPGHRRLEPDHPQRHRRGQPGRHRTGRPGPGDPRHAQEVDGAGWCQRPHPGASASGVSSVGRGLTADRAGTAEHGPCPAQ